MILCKYIELLVTNIFSFDRMRRWGYERSGEESTEPELCGMYDMLRLRLSKVQSVSALFCLYICFAWTVFFLFCTVNELAICTKRHWLSTTSHSTLWFTFFLLLSSHFQLHLLPRLLSSWHWDDIDNPHLFGVPWGFISIPHVFSVFRRFFLQQQQSTSISLSNNYRIHTFPILLLV